MRTGLGIEIGRTTVADILAAAGIEPASEREKTRTWKQFMKAHWDSLCACDFFSVEALGIAGTVRYMVFFVIAVKTRAVEVAEIRVDPDGEWMKQMARNLTDSVDGFLRNAAYPIHDRDPLFTAAFRDILKDGGVKCARIPAQSPNCSAHAERFVPVRLPIGGQAAATRSPAWPHLHDHPPLHPAAAALRSQWKGDALAGAAQIDQPAGKLPVGVVADAYPHHAFVRLVRRGAQSHAPRTRAPG